MPKMSSSITHPPHVLIVGAGLGGLLLAQALRKQQIPFTVFEKDSSLHARTQGWAIGLHSFLNDLSSCIPEDLPSVETTNHLLPLSLPAEACMYPPSGPKLYVQSTASQPIIRANRQRLRDWLATNIDVQFNKHTTSIIEANDQVTLHFSDGTSATGDLLVGADGVHSQVRAHLLNDPHHKRLQNFANGVIVAEVTLDRAAFERQLKLAHSAYIALGHAFHVFVGLQSVADDGESAKYYWFVIWDDKDAGKRDFWTTSASKEELYRFATEKTQSLHPSLTEILRLTGPEGVVTPSLVFRDMVLRQDGMPAGRKITLLGDAAHPMAPYRGEGGCHAMIDALKLAKVLGEGGKDGLMERLDGYQHEMLERGAEAVVKSRTANEQGSGDRIVWGQRVSVAQK